MPHYGHSVLYPLRRKFRMRYHITAPFGPKKLAVGSLNHSFVSGLGLKANIRLQSCDTQATLLGITLGIGFLPECIFEGKT